MWDIFQVIFLMNFFHLIFLLSQLRGAALPPAQCKQRGLRRLRRRVRGFSGEVLCQSCMLTNYYGITYTALFVKVNHIIAH